MAAAANQLVHIVGAGVGAAAAAQRSIPAAPPAAMTWDIPPNTQLASFLVIHQQLGRGAFGAVYDATDVRTGARLAVKVEPVDSSTPQLAYEHAILQNLRGEDGVPRVYWIWQHAGLHFMGMQRLGDNLETVRLRSEGGVLTQAQVAVFAHAALQRLRVLHERGMAYRDVKPENFVYGLPGSANARTVFLVDYGTAKSMYTTRGSHLVPARITELTGTPRFASLRAHDGYQCTRRDDIEALGYLCVYLARGRLPWQGLKGTPSGRAAKSAKSRKTTTPFVDSLGPVGNGGGGVPSKDVKDVTAAALETMPKRDALFADVGHLKRLVALDDLCRDLDPAFAATIAHGRLLAYDALPDFDALLANWAAVVK